MKIPLDVRYHFGGYRAMISFFVKSEKIGLKNAIVSFIVDSGSPETIIGSKDLSKFRASTIRIRKLNKKILPVAYAGSNINPRMLDDIEFTGRNSFKTKFPVLICDEGDHRQMSVLGIDFLEEHNFTFVFNPKKRKAYLENDDSTPFDNPKNFL